MPLANGRTIGLVHVFDKRSGRQGPSWISEDFGGLGIDKLEKAVLYDINGVIRIFQHQAVILAGVLKHLVDLDPLACLTGPGGGLAWFSHILSRDCRFNATVLFLAVLSRLPGRLQPDLGGAGAVIGDFRPLFLLRKYRNTGNVCQIFWVRVGSGRRRQGTKRFFVAKLGSLVRLTPRRLRPASSPGVGMWVMWTSQFLSSLSLSMAS